MDSDSDNDNLCLYINATVLDNVYNKKIKEIELVVILY